MKVLIVIATVFTLCCCFSDLNIIPYETSGRKFPLSNPILTDEEIERCRYFMYNIGEDLEQTSGHEELQEKCSRILQRGARFLVGGGDGSRSPPLESEKYEFVALPDSTTGGSEGKKNQKMGSVDTSRSLLVTEQYETSSTEKQPVGFENQKAKSDILSPVNTNWSLWSFLPGASESSDNSSSVLIAVQNDASPIGKQSDKPEVQKTKSDASPVRMSWSLWSLILSTNSSDSSKENRLEEKDRIAESGIGFENSTTEIPSTWNIIMPGTKWCGKGSVAAHDDDLGYFEDVDRCCRAHDKCDDLMLPGEYKYNLKNTSPFCVLHCKCDDEFYGCLSQINSVASHTVGHTYFNLFARMCYALDYPRKCKTYAPLLGCTDFEIHKTAEKVYQWKPSKKYLQLPFVLSK